MYGNTNFYLNNGIELINVRLFSGQYLFNNFAEKKHKKNIKILKWLLFEECLSMYQKMHPYYVTWYKKRGNYVISWTYNNVI